MAIMLKYPTQFLAILLYSFTAMPKRNAAAIQAATDHYLPSNAASCRCCLSPLVPGTARAMMGRYLPGSLAEAQQIELNQLQYGGSRYAAIT